MDFRERFNKVSSKAAKACGSVSAFAGAVGLIVGWAACGWFYNWSEGHSLFINTVTTIITFLMVFVIQNSQNRDSQAIQLKLDEIIRGQRGSRNAFIRIEDLDEKSMRRLQEEMRKLKAGEIILKTKRNERVKPIAENPIRPTSRDSQESVGQGTLDSQRQWVLWEGSGI